MSSKLLNYFNHPAKGSFILSLIQHPQEAITVKGVAGSSFAMLAASCIENIDKTHFFIFPDKESAAFFYHDLEVLLQDQNNGFDEKKVHFLPASFHRLYDWKELDITNIKLRSEIVDRIVHGADNLTIVSYTEAIMEKLVSANYLKENSFTVKQGELLPVDIFLEFLYAYEYKQEDFVFEPGQFAWRGAIFDLFSYSEEYPFRIELEGDTVSSIRLFDTETQLSLREVTEMHIMPSIISSEKISKTPFWDYLPASTHLWIFKADEVYRQIDQELSQLETSYKTENLHDTFIDGNTFLQMLNRRGCVEINSSLQKNITSSFDFEIKPQRHFAKNFDMLLKEWGNNLEHGFQTLFLSENTTQHERMNAIIQDLLVKYNDKHHANYSRNMLFKSVENILHEGFRDEKGKVCLYTDHQFFEKYHRFTIRDRYKKSESFTLKELNNLQQGDYVVHVDHGIGIYQGLAKMDVNGKEQEVIQLGYKEGDTLYISIHSLHKITKYTGKDGSPPALHRLGSGVWEKTKERTKKRLKELIIDLVKLYAKRKTKKGFAYSPDSYLQTELEASFIYEDTPDQLKTTQEVKTDMENDVPMDRLVCGDVGFGKTEVAIRAAFKAVADSKQVAILVPTTVLALQHFNTFSERLTDMPCTVDYINRFKTSKDLKTTLQKVKEGKIDILIGTHRILSKDVEFKDLGLLVIDEEQKFGVAAKEKLREIRVSVDTLAMSATPIPRTLQFSLMGVRDISVITTPPPNRYPIQTEIHTFNEVLIKDAINYEISRGGQVFFVHNKVQNIREVADMVQRVVPSARIAIGHGQMEGVTLEKIMLDFINGKYDVLIATTIIESGLDIPNANTMIINDAQNFALNVLHQLRGRVGRNNKQAFCYMLVPSMTILNDNARKRLKAIEDFSDIGSGFQIAMRDLDIRGAGDVLGAEQSGFINEIGFEMYQKIINEAIMELKESSIGSEMADTSRLIPKECLIETDLGLQIPSDYVVSVSERMNLYKELDAINDMQKLERFHKKLEDIFGALPQETEELLKIIPLRKKALTFHFEKIVLKNRQFTGYFTDNMDSPFFQSSLFSNILNFLQKYHPRVEMKQVNNKPQLIIKNIHSIQDAMEWLGKMV